MISRPALNFMSANLPVSANTFLHSVYSDIDLLLLYAGVHRVVFGFHRALSKRFPFAIFLSF